MKESRRKFLSKLPTRAYTISMIAGSIASTGCERSSILVDSTNIKNATIDPSLLGSAAEGVALGVFCLCLFS